MENDLLNRINEFTTIIGGGAAIGLMVLAAGMALTEYKRIRHFDEGPKVITRIQPLNNYNEHRRF